jgi:glycine betaine transporter
MKKLTPVFIISVIIAAVFIVWGVIPEAVLGSAALTPVTSAIHSFIIEKFGWYYLLAATLFLVFTLYLIFSKYGNIKLGKPDEKPQYGYVSWFAMLFSSGMGI